LHQRGGYIQLVEDTRGAEVDGFKAMRAQGEIELTESVGADTKVLKAWIVHKAYRLRGILTIKKDVRDLVIRNGGRKAQKSVRNPHDYVTQAGP
jgi:hypothetical protein